MSFSASSLERRLQRPDEPLAQLLPVAIALAMTLRQDATARWLTAEFEGYPDNSSLPRCRRRLPGRIMARSPQSGWIPAPVTEYQIRNHARIDVYDSIQEVEQFCLSGTRSSARRVPLPGDTMQLLQSSLGLTADLALTIRREHYCQLVRVTRGAIYLWVSGLTGLGLGSTRDGFRDHEKQLATLIDTPELYLRQAQERIRHLPVPDIPEAGFFERIFRRAG